MHFEIPVPPSTNNLFATIAGKRRSTTDYLRWQRQADLLIMLQQREQARIAPPVAVTVTIPQSKQRRDLDNYLKAALDALVRCRVIPDDSDLVVKRITAQIGATMECRVDVEGFVK